MSRPLRTLCLAHLLGNAVLLWLGYYWLGLGEESAGVLLWSLLVAGMLLKGYVFSSFRFAPGVGVHTAVYLMLGSWLALLGAWFALGLKATNEHE